MERFLSLLNEKQLESVVYDHTKALQVVAGPGTGKTKVLTTRVAYLLLEKGLSPNDIVITTFTKKATLEMIERIGFLLEGSGINPKSLWIGTFHSICARVLRQHGWRIELPKDWRTFSDNDTDPIFAKLVEKMPDQIRDYAHSYNRKINLLRPSATRDWAVHPAAVKKMVSWLKSEGLTADEYRARNDHDPALLHFYEQYQAELKSQHALDFDDLLLNAFKLLSKQRCLPNIKHVLVDEFQDTNSIQLNLMYLFARGNGTHSQGITAVGDPDQSIYAFRNALAGNFEDMITNCPIPCARIILVENYRSSQRILTTSEMLIKQQLTGRDDRLPLRAQFDSGFPPVHIQFPAKFLESRALARELIYLRSLPNLWNYNDFAMLVRQRRQIRPLEISLIEHRIPYKIVNGRAFWELKEINGMMDLMKCVYSDYEKNAFLRALQYPPRGVGAATVKKLEGLFTEYESPFEALKALSSLTQKNEMPVKVTGVISNFVQLIEKCRVILADATNSKVMGTLFEELYEGSGLRHEYLYLDGKKKADLGSKPEADYSNKRHLNILILAEHVANFKPMDGDLVHKEGTHGEDMEEDDEVNIHDVLREFIDSVNLYSTETEVDESKMSEKQIRQKKRREGEGFVTISTIHGAKGLEWPVVMIPGCVEGLIPCVYGNKDESDDSESDDDSDGGKTTGKSTNSPKKKRPKTNEGSLDEERRMFFVAQTRAKYLLYLTSTLTNDSESKYESSVPSRFLTTELVKTMCDEQKALDSLVSIQTLYYAAGKTPPTEVGDFSLEALIKDYKMFLSYRRERMIWKGATVIDASRIKIDENVNKATTNYGFTTAAMQLKNSPSSCSEKKYAPSISCKRERAQRTSSDLGTLSGNNTAPAYQLSRSHSNGSAAAKMYAPKPTVTRNIGKVRSFAPNADGNSQIRNRKDHLLSESDQKLESDQKPESDHLVLNSDKYNTGVRSLSDRQTNRCRRTIIADSIDLGEISDSESEPVVDIKREESSKATSITMKPETLRRSHPVEGLSYGARVADAKRLADSISSTIGQKRAPLPMNEQKKVKLEVAKNGADILSRLSQAKRRPTEPDDTVIVID
ncbi:LADA_0C09758g1_1 [Lachancea dasiensis]|uniref:DNA 3'-5' helicase n=1 Tax=Lachancea dasiensis TaxID=1072105 RepID=A0A1G4J0P2_9SACH|nr:LADA_0C09758g1_1 [Lachancea dasiensis]